MIARQSWTSQGTSRSDRAGIVFRSVGPAVATALLVVDLLLLGPAAAAEPVQPADRVRVDIGMAPWSAVGRINNSAYGRCSAVLVRADIAVTAAHCLYNISSRRFLQPASIHLLFGFSRGRYGFHTTATEITIAPGYQPGGVAAAAPHDWAVLRLKDTAPPAFQPMAVADRADAAPETVRAAGFAQERSEVLTATQPCAVLSAPDTPTLVTDCRLTHGFSGGPMIDDRSGKLVAISVAVQPGGERPLGIAVPISSVVAALPDP